MIEIVIKRNGEREPFSAAKLNGWSEWAAKNLGRKVNWSEVVLHVVSVLPKEATSEEIQLTAIKFLIDKHTWEHNLMAGRLYSDLMKKQIHKSKKYPSVMELHGEMIADGVMVPMDYSKEEYDQIEKIIDHSLNQKSAHYSLQQNRYKYAIRNKVTGREYETQQFIYMRMAMALSEFEPKETRMTDVAKFYEHLANKRINAPTPYYVNLGTVLKGYASCCVYTSGDSWPSLLAGDVIAYTMTCMSAGIGGHIKTRSIGDPVRGGLIRHQGKLPYYRAQVGMINANMQNGRGGAETMHYTAYDPEVEVIQKLKNPLTPRDKQIRGLDYSFGTNMYFAEQVAKNGQIALFSYRDAPELYESMYSKDPDDFKRLYEKFLKSKKKRTMVNARDILIGAETEAAETGRHYQHNTYWMNVHTPFKEPIYSSNLCQEIMLPTKPFNSPEDLYGPYVEGKSGEIALCNIAGIVPANIESDEQYAEVAYYTLKMIDFGIHMGTYEFESLEYTAKSRMNAGVGVVGLAHYMAKNSKKYDDQEGRDFIHQTFETHMWHLINASLRLGKEKGNAPWMHKTKWPEGWLPIDTYSKAVDDFVTIDNLRDWESLRKLIIENRGIHNSVLAAHMPAESSSLASETTNGVYPIRDAFLVKTTETMAMVYVVPEYTKYAKNYQIAYDIETADLIKDYAIMQKWTDQGISADEYVKVQGTDQLKTADLIKNYLLRTKAGLKSRYYFNSLTAKGINLNGSESQTSSSNEPEQDTTDDAVGCGSGGCTL